MLCDVTLDQRGCVHGDASFHHDIECPCSRVPMAKVVAGLLLLGCPLHYGHTHRAGDRSTQLPNSGGWDRRCSIGFWHSTSIMLLTFTSCILPLLCYCFCYSFAIVHCYYHSVAAIMAIAITISIFCQSALLAT